MKIQQYLKIVERGGGLKYYFPVIEDFGLGKTVIEPKTLGTTGLCIEKYHHQVVTKSLLIQILKLAITCHEFYFHINI